MEEMTFQDPKVAELSRKLVPVHLNVDDNQALAERFRLDGIPRAFVLAPNGKIQAHTEGYNDPRQFSAFLQTGLTKGGRP
ncbi:MAG: hypothetical protein C4321_03600 [Chloroflexota bacterium]